MVKDQEYVFLPKRLVVLVSGRGSNLQAILSACASGQIPATEVVAVISNRPQAAALALAAAAGIPVRCVDHRRFGDRSSFDAALRAQIDDFAPDHIALAGFMRRLTPEFAQHYGGRMVNIHPSLLPAFPGLHTHAQALAEGVKLHGATVHFVTADLDGGPIIVQGAVPVLAQDDVDSLATRVLAMEHRIYPQAIAWLVSGRLRMEQGKVTIDGEKAGEFSPCIWPGTED